MTSVQDLKDGESIRIVSGCGDSTMHIIKAGETLFVRQDTTIKCLNSTDKEETNQFAYQHFSNANGEPADTLDIIKEVRSTSHDRYTLLLCEMIFDQFYGKDKH